MINDQVNKDKAKNKASKIKIMFESYFPNGASLLTACSKYKELYPDSVRDIANYICGQAVLGNFKKTNYTDINGHVIYVLDKPTRREKILRKIASCDLRIKQAKKTKKKFLELLSKLDKESLNEKGPLPLETWDLS